jgi:WD40 repeat protein
MYQFWEVGTWKMLRELPRHDAGRMPGAGAFSRDGTLLALTRTRSLVQLIDPASATDLASLEIPNPRHITALAFSPDGTYLALCASDETMRIWNIQDVRARLKELKLDWGSSLEERTRERRGTRESGTLGGSEGRVSNRLRPRLSRDGDVVPPGAHQSCRERSRDLSPDLWGAPETLRPDRHARPREHAVLDLRLGTGST